MAGHSSSGHVCQAGATWPQAPASHLLHQCTWVASAHCPAGQLHFLPLCTFGRQTHPIYKFSAHRGCCSALLAFTSTTLVTLRNRRARGCEHFFADLKIILADAWCAVGTRAHGLPLTYTPAAATSLCAREHWIKVGSTLRVAHAPYRALQSSNSGAVASYI